MPVLTIDDLQRAGMTIPDVRFAGEIEAFVRVNRASPPAPGGVLFVGDSDIRLWAPIEEYFPALPVVSRGFGGARTWEVLLHFDRLVLSHGPRVIVYCAGDNDISTLLETGAASAVTGFRLFLDQVRTHLPETRRVLYLYIHPLLCNRPKWPIGARANVEIKAICDASGGLAEFMDYAHLLCDGLHEPRGEYFRKDQMHFVVPFYRILSQFLRPRIEAAMSGG